MKHIINYGLKFLSGLFFIVALGFTAVQTYSLIFQITSGNIVTAILGLIMFEFAMIYWWLKFQYEADGIPQLALSGLLAVVALVFVLSATALKLGAVPLDAFGDNTANMLITAAVIVNVTAKLLYPLLSQEKMEEIWQKALSGMWTLRAFQAAERHSEERVKELAGQLGTHMYNTAQLNLMTKYGLSSMALPMPAQTATADGVGTAPEPEESVELVEMEPIIIEDTAELEAEDSPLPVTPHHSLNGHGS